MIEMVIILLLPLAVWRISSILHREEGPLDIAQKLRQLVGVKYDEFSEPYGRNVIAQAFSCMWCLSVWVALILTIIVVYLPHSMSAVIVAPFGLSALAIFIDTLMTRG